MDQLRGMIRILVIGSLPPPLGGCSVTLQHLVQALRALPDVEVRVLDTKGIRGRGLAGARRLAVAIAELLRVGGTVDVVTLHVATTALPFWGLAVLGVTRLFGRALVVRKFASTDTRWLGPVRRRLAHAVAAAADVYFVETRELLALSRQRGLVHTHWFPNARPIPEARAPERQGPCRRFVFVGQVRREKGLGELVQAMEGMPDGVTVDVFGPRYDDLPHDLFERRRAVAYRGELDPAEVPRRLAEYDAFVLPTLWTHEGYPGVVLEAYAAGLPVIASRIGGIPEIVDSSVGFLVEPGDVGELRRAMDRLVADPEVFRVLRSNVRGRAEQFSTRRWAGELVSHCRAAVAARG